MDEKASDRKDELAKTGQLRQNEAMMKRLFLVFSLVAILTAVCGVHAYVPDPADAYAFESSKTLVPRSLSGWIICRNDPINKFDPDGRTVESALKLIAENRQLIKNTAKYLGGRVTPVLLARVVFQENRNDMNLVKNDDRSSFLGVGGPEIKNAIGGISVRVANQNRSFGIAEMKTDTAANLFGADAGEITRKDRTATMEALKDPATALLLAGMELNRLAEVAAANGETVSDDVLLSRYNSGNESGGLTEVGQRSSGYLIEIEAYLNSNDQE